jgi:hypothetical protein
VLANKLPNLVDPVTKSTDEVIVCTTNVCAVNVFLTNKLSAEDAVNAVVAIDAVPDIVPPPAIVIDPLILILPDTDSEPVIVG